MKRILATLILAALPLVAEEPKQQTTDQPRTFMGCKVISRIQYGVQPAQVALKSQPSPLNVKTTTVTTVKLLPSQPKGELKMSDLIASPHEKGVYYDTRPRTAPAMVITTTTVKK